MKISRLLTALLVMLVIGTTSTAQDAGKVWREIVRPCALNELQGKKVILLGLSNNVEVGTLLRPRKEQGGYGRASYQNIVQEYERRGGPFQPVEGFEPGAIIVESPGGVNRTR